MSALTAGHWQLVEPEQWPWDLLVMRGEEEILRMKRHAHSTDQKSLSDCLAGVGFDPRAEIPDFRRDAVVAALATQRANALLIAAAPDLYEALEMVRDADEDCKRDKLPTIPPLARAKIDAALAKARGGQ